jgi:ABC-type Fe3+/spermidine/putrescine transport system ATPase subunit
VPSVKLVDVSKRFGQILAVDRVNLEIRDRDYVCILGPTGSGKTTLLKSIAGLTQVDEGEISLDGKRVNELPPERRNAVYVPQRYALFPHLTVEENVSFGPIAKGIRRDEAAAESRKMLELVRLARRAGSLPGELSGGMQQRVALARGLASGARLLLLDEPLGALDARLRIELRYQLKGLAKDLGLTVIHVTHDQAEAMAIADAVVVLRDGRVEQMGTPFHIYLRPANLFVANFIGDTNFIEGIVAERGVSGSTIELRRSLYIKVADASFLPGERVVVALRQEKAHVLGDAEGGPNALVGQVQAIRFLGSFVKCELVLENGDNVSCKFMRGGRAPREGERATVTFRPEDGVVFPYPSTGLTREVDIF